jgi:hypothetical protein
MIPESLSRRVFECAHCEGARLPFVRDAAGKFFRFPPIIGAVGPCPLLFVGINPRVSSSNRQLHERIVRNWVAFETLGRNRVAGDTYIGRPGIERHYALHVKVAQALFPAKPFDSVASVTELHFCASESSAGLPLDTSECANRHFGAVLEGVRPRVVFAVGSHVERVLRANFSRPGGSDIVTYSGGQAGLVVLPHPNAFGPKREPFALAVAQARAFLSEISA